MTSLEKFLIKKTETKTSEEIKKDSSLNQGPNNELISTISHLKAIFPNESEENLTLLALQHQNPRDLEEAVQRLLDKGKAFQEFKDEWSTVSARDKKKPEVKKEYRKKRFQKDFEEENRAIPGYYSGKGRPQKNKRQENSYRPKDTQRANQGNEKVLDIQQSANEEKEKNTDIHEEISLSEENSRKIEENPRKTEENPRKTEENPRKTEENPRKTEEIRKNTEETPNSTEETKKNESNLNQTLSKNQEFPSLNPEKVWSESPPQEIKVAKFNHPPATIPEETKRPSETQEKKQSLNSQDSRTSALRSETRDFGVQVDFDYGIPIVIYPYMFGRAK